MTNKQKKLYEKYGNPDDKDFIKKNLIKIDFLEHNVLIHKKEKSKFQAVNDIIKTLNLSYKFRIVQTYCNRQMRGSKLKSLHSWGIAVDINPDTNGYYTGWEASEENRKNWKRDIPLKVIQVFESNGFIWGGKWKTVKDFMHFEVKT